MPVIIGKCLLLLLILNLENFVSAVDEIKDERDSAHRDPTALWFGPRLGKRSLRLTSEDNREPFLRLLEAADALKFYYDQIPSYDTAAEDTEPSDIAEMFVTPVAKKVMFTPKSGRSTPKQEKTYNNFDFTPRLGRRNSDDMPANPPDQDMYRANPDQGGNRGKYFTSRLGRNTNFTPRLGRQLIYEYPEKVRVVRSPNKTKST